MKSFLPVFVCCFLLMACVPGCEHKKENTATSGKIIVLVSEAYLPLLQSLTTEFTSLYPEAQFDVRPVSTREAIVHLLNDSVHTICIDRQFNDEEHRIADQAGMKIVENHIADDAVALVVHELNPLGSISADIAKKIIDGTVTRWEQIPGSKQSGAIDVVLTGKNSGLYELLQTTIFHGMQQLTVRAAFPTQHDVLAYIAQHPFAVGFVSASVALSEHPKQVKLLSLDVVTEDGSHKKMLPGPSEIYQTLYPFKYSLYLYTAEAKAATGTGLTAFVLSYNGQRIIQKAGLVPEKIPTRTIQLTAE
ncbi:MAG TPA: substrate-binding domain-containing protein [Bacteroidota bacterium]|nr:substrate-binding domain-containing protein [Bacteroidota bacterium]